MTLHIYIYVSIPNIATSRKVMPGICRSSDFLAWRIAGECQVEREHAGRDYIHFVKALRSSCDHYENIRS